jgi:hypothetical protein
MKATPAEVHYDTIILLQDGVESTLSVSTVLEAPAFEPAEANLTSFGRP